MEFINSKEKTTVKTQERGQLNCKKSMSTRPTLYLGILS